MMYAETQRQMQTLKRHPIRGGLYGLLLGLGAALFMIGQKMIAFGTLPPILVVVAGIVVGVLWSLFAPAKAAKDDAPMPVEQPYVPPDRVDQTWGTSTSLADPYGAPQGDSGYSSPVDEPTVADDSYGRPQGSPPPPPPPPPAG